MASTILKDDETGAAYSGLASGTFQARIAQRVKEELRKSNQGRRVRGANMNVDRYNRLVDQYNAAARRFDRTTASAVIDRDNKTLGKAARQVSYYEELAAKGGISVDKLPARDRQLYNDAKARLAKYQPKAPDAPVTDFPGADVDAITAAKAKQRSKTRARSGGTSTILSS